MKLKLPSVILTLLKKHGATVDSSLRASRAQVVKTCKENGYPAHRAVIAFEDAFGGLTMPDEPGKKKNQPYWLFGTNACLSSGAHVRPTGGSKSRKLVPVAYSPNDIIYFLDERGNGYAEDTVEDTKATLYAETGKSLVCRIILDDVLFSRKETSIDLPGLQGDAISKRLSLKLVREASGKDRRYFSDAKADVLVLEDIKARKTCFAGATKKQLTLVSPPLVSGARKVTPEMKPFLGKASVRMVAEQRTSLPEFFEHLPELRELDVSINKLEQLPESLWRATQLTKLDLSHNPLKILPEGIGNMKALRSLSLRGCPIEMLPGALTGAKNLSWLVLTECDKLDVDAALSVIARLPKLKELWLPLSRSLTSLTPIAHLPLQSLCLNGANVQRPVRLPAGLGQLKKLQDLRIEYADEVAQLPEALEDVEALRLLFSRSFSDRDIKESARRQPEKMYLKVFADTL
ncbi:MAG TPA: leucine-rich repeat domain-containing protein [Cyclobacteriaceae bacterium]|nr:leucine-rich repeat domain-containing protein [Cyclobacteriaceae bacterium]